MKCRDCTLADDGTILAPRLGCFSHHPTVESTLKGPKTNASTLLNTLRSSYETPILDSQRTYNSTPPDSSVEWYRSLPLEFTQHSNISSSTIILFPTNPIKTGRYSLRVEEMKNAVVYLRMSSKKQDTSIQQQREQIGHWVEGKYNVLREYIDEGKSGSKNTEKRTGFLQLVADAENLGDFEAIICLDNSRFGRLDALEGSHFKLRLRNCGVYLDTVLDGKTDWTTANGQIIDTVYSVKNSEFAIDLGRRSVVGRIHSARSGRPQGGQPPYGMNRKVVDEKGTEHVLIRGEKMKIPKGWTVSYVPGDRYEKQIVEWLFSEFLSRDVSIRQLSLELNEKGVPSPGDSKWRSLTVQRILENREYIGDFVYGKKNIKNAFHRITSVGPVRNQGGKRQKQVTTDDDERIVVPGVHEGIIDRELFYAVRKKLYDRRTRGFKYRSDGGFPLSGVIFCGHCGRTLLAQRKSYKSGPDVVYHCGSAKNQPGCKCGLWRVRQSEVLPKALDIIREKMNTELLERLHGGPTRTPDHDVGRLQKELVRIQKFIEQGNRRIVSVADHLVNGIEKELVRLNAEKEKIEAQLMGRDPVAERSKEYAKWWDENSKEFIVVPTGETVSYQNAWIGKRETEVEVPVLPVTVRQTLKEIGCKIDVTWRKGRWGRNGKFKVESIRIGVDTSKSSVFLPSDRTRSALR